MFTALGAEADEKMGGDMRGESSRNVLQHYLSVIRVKCKKQKKKRCLNHKKYTACVCSSLSIRQSHSIFNHLKILLHCSQQNNENVEKRTQSEGRCIQENQ